MNEAGKTSTQTKTARYIAVTGGPGSGKTTLMEALARRGFATMPEAGRAIIQSQVAIGGRGLHWGDRALFAELMLAHELRNFAEAAERDGPIFFDRGVLDLAGYLALCGLDVPEHVRRAVAIYRYAPTVFAAPPWIEIFGNDAERKQDFAEAVSTYEHCVSAYRAAGYDVLDLPRADVDTRVAFVLDRLQ